MEANHAEGRCLSFFWRSSLAKGSLLGNHVQYFSRLGKSKQVCVCFDRLITSSDHPPALWESSSKLKCELNCSDDTQTYVDIRWSNRDVSTFLQHLEVFSFNIFQLVSNTWPGLLYLVFCLEAKLTMVSLGLLGIYLDSIMFFLGLTPLKEL